MYEHPMKSKCILWNLLGRHTAFKFARISQARSRSVPNYAPLIAVSTFGARVPKNGGYDTVRGMWRFVSLISGNYFSSLSRLVSSKRLQFKKYKSYKISQRRPGILPTVLHSQPVTCMTLLAAQLLRFMTFRVDICNSQSAHTAPKPAQMSPESRMADPATTFSG